MPTGKVRYVGHSNFAGWQLADAAWPAPGRSRTPFISRAERVLVAAARSRGASCCRRRSSSGLGMLPYFPLANGLLTGKYRRRRRAGGQPAHRPQAGLLADRAVGPRGSLRAFADERGMTMVRRRVRLAAGPGTAVTVGDRRRDHPGPDPGERRSGHRLDTRRRRPRRDRRDLPRPGLTSAGPGGAGHATSARRAPGRESRQHSTPPGSTPLLGATEWSRSDWSGVATASPAPAPRSGGRSAGLGPADVPQSVCCRPRRQPVAGPRSRTVSTGSPTSSDAARSISR